MLNLRVGSVKDLLGSTIAGMYTTPSWSVTAGQQCLCCLGQRLHPPRQCVGSFAALRDKKTTCSKVVIKSTVHFKTKSFI